MTTQQIHCDRRKLRDLLGVIPSMYGDYPTNAERYQIPPDRNGVALELWIEPYQKIVGIQLQVKEARTPLMALSLRDVDHVDINEVEVETEDGSETVNLIEIGPARTRNGVLLTVLLSLGDEYSVDIGTIDEFLRDAPTSPSDAAPN